MILQVYTRIFVDTEALESTIDFYTRLLGGHISLRFAYPEQELELAAVSSTPLSVLIIAGAPDKRAPFEETRLTIRVDRLEAHLDGLTAAGAAQLEPVQKTPVGRKTRFRHRDGLVVEYVENDTPS